MDIQIEMDAIMLGDFASLSAHNFSGAVSAMGAWHFLTCECASLNVWFAYAAIKDCKAHQLLALTVSEYHGWVEVSCSGVRARASQILPRTTKTSLCGLFL